MTLTTKRSLDAAGLSKAVGELLHRVNTKLFGTAYKRHRKAFLATYTVQEPSFHQGLHAHILIGVPEGSLGLKAFAAGTSVPDLLTSTWCSLDHGGRREGQDVQEITDFRGAFRYTHKHIFDLASFDNVDVANTKFPEDDRLSPKRG